MMPAVPSYSEQLIPCAKLRSLVWESDHLVDWAGGGKRYGLDGSSVNSRISFAYAFDAAVATSDGSFAVLYQRLGTKGVVVTANSIVREINRSFYHANAYEYPICIWERPNTKPALIHCPNEYNRLEIEDLESGQPLLPKQTSDPPDFFHSRLSVSPSGSRLMSAGWFWHPFDAANIFSLTRLRENCGFHNSPLTVDTANEVSSASWITDDLILAANTDDYEYEEDEEFRPGSLGVWSIASKTWDEVAVPKVKLGQVMPIGRHHAVSFHTHPRLMEIKSGVILHEWPHISSGEQTSSIIHHLDFLPHIAIDLPRRRFAIANSDSIHVVTIRVE